MLLCKKSLVCFMTCRVLCSIRCVFSWNGRMKRWCCKSTSMVWRKMCTYSRRCSTNFAAIYPRTGKSPFPSGANLWELTIPTQHRRVLCNNSLRKKAHTPRVYLPILLPMNSICNSLRLGLTSQCRFMNISKMRISCSTYSAWVDVSVDS